MGYAGWVRERNQALKAGQPEKAGQWGEVTVDAAVRPAPTPPPPVAPFSQPGLCRAHVCARCLAVAGEEASVWACLSQERLRLWLESSLGCTAFLSLFLGSHQDAPQGWSLGLAGFVPTRLHLLCLALRAPAPALSLAIFFLETSSFMVPWLGLSGGSQRRLRSVPAP